MASILELKNQVKTLQDFNKVVNIQKIVVMKEIAQWQKVISKAKAFENALVNLLIDIQKKFKSFPNEMFHDPNRKYKKGLIPVERDLHFFIQGNVSDNLGEYEYKLIAEFCKKTYSPNDVYVIVGEQLSQYMQQEGLLVLNTFKLTSIADTSIYQRIAFQTITAFQDLIFNKATFGYLNTSSKTVEVSQFFPFSLEKKQLEEEAAKNALDSLDGINLIDVSKVAWEKDQDAVAQMLARLTAESTIYLNIVEYSLAMKMRELQALDDKEKNISAEIEMVKLKMQRVRKEVVTNELLTNATAFSALAEEEEEE